VHRQIRAARTTSSGVLFLLLRTEDITSGVFVCPSSNATPDVYGGGTNTALNQINFTNAEQPELQLRLSLSDTNALVRLQDGSGPGSAFAVAADINPGTTGNGGNQQRFGAQHQQLGQQMLQGNSKQPCQTAQNVLFWRRSRGVRQQSVCRHDRDNIYTRGARPGAQRQDLLVRPYVCHDSVLCRWQRS